MKWKLILFCFLFLCAIQAVNAQIEESTEEDNTDAFNAITTGNNSEGFQSTTEGYNSEGFRATTYGRSGEGFFAITHGYNSEGFQAVTGGRHSEGFFANTAGNQSEGFEAETYGSSSEGFYATTHGYNSEGFQAVTHGRHSEGFFTRTYGDKSEGVFAYSQDYHGVVGKTPGLPVASREACGGLFLNPGYMGDALGAGRDYDDINFKVRGNGDVFTNGRIAASSISSRGGISARGSKSFVMDHPQNESKEIVYTSLEGDEAGVYTRGTAQLEDGSASIQLPEHFGLVASDEGLTVQVTPLGNCNGLYVAHKSNQKIVVEELMNGKSDVQFDYYVHGIRIGYEEYEVIRDKN
ncbi:hypothetical protein [Methanohalophilus mahii]|uniref:Uncharacterized protein n=1 Tax=Methanohalophilus mahii (strain ATCC 35705 / DSM 5219 / SLP) TaxID=547558 RepID=D5E6Y0_METMS|nr:hypothetical protein [Methanohalophilus mahii]ADE36918.1 hypothetical protein Mmah_1420 [Methanohalophilus mahii DSM 5219]